MTGAGDKPPSREIIWSPWRMKYIRGKKPEGCVFCEVGDADPEEDEERYVVFRGGSHYVVLNIWPYNNGHAMVVPFRHITDITEMTDEESLEMLRLAGKLVDAYRSCMEAQGVNLGLNLGRVSGGSIEHLHFHLVPRWMGDVNFMPVIGHTKVLVEMLSETYERLRAEAANWAEGGSGG